MAENKPKKKSFFTAVLLVFIIVVTTPLLAFSAIYFLSDDFRLFANPILSNIPGPVGSYFDSQPTRADILSKIRQVSEYYLSLEESRAMDKLKVLQKEDSVAHTEVIKEMIRLNPNKTKSILEAIRATEHSGDALSAQLKEKENENIESLKELASYLSNLPLGEAVSELRQLYAGTIDGYEKSAKVLEYVDVPRATDLLYSLETTDKNRILHLLSEGKRREILLARTKQEEHRSALLAESVVLKQKSSDEMAKLAVGYSEEDLATILLQFGAKKAARVLSKVQTEEFVTKVIAKLSEIETRLHGKDRFTPDLMLGLKVYKEYDDNLKELVKVYSKMPTQKVSDITRTMLINQQPSKVYQLSSGEDILISDEELIIDILKDFNVAKRSEVLGSLDPALSSEITRRLALPEE